MRMADVRIYDFEFNLLCIVHDIISSNWTVKYNDIGTFEGHFGLDDDIVQIAMENQYIVAVQGDYQAIITGKQVQGNEFILYGKTCNWILSRRVTPDFDSTDAPSTNIETMARWIVSQAFSDVSNFVLGTACGATATNAFWRNTYNSTDSVVMECLANANLGHNVVFNRTTQQWIFNVLQGETLPIIVSKGNKNAYDMQYAEDLQDYYSGAWYEQEQEEDTEGNTPNPIWTHIDKDVKTGIYKWDCVVSDTTDSAANSSLVAKKHTAEITTKTNGLVHGIDYNLGDIVRVQCEWGQYKQTVPKRIIGVNLWYENNNIGQEPIFED